MADQHNDMNEAAAALAAAATSLAAAAAQFAAASGACQAAKLQLNWSRRDGKEMVDHLRAEIARRPGVADEALGGAEATRG